MRWTHIDERSVDNIVILDLSDPQPLQTDPERRVIARVREVLSKGHRKIVLNLHELRYIDGDGLGQIVEAYESVSATGGSLKLCDVTSSLRQALMAARLEGVLDAYDSEQDAVHSFSAGF